MSTPTPKPAEQVSYRWLFWILALLNLLAAIWVVWDESVTRRPWKGYQEQFNELLAQRGERAVAINIRQVTNPELDVVDRCQTCHLGIDRAGLTGDEVPPVFRTHPRRDQLLGSKHPVERFGCTVCHRGEGAQTKGIGWREFDHGRNDPYWDQPMLSPIYAESACVGCHTDERAIAGADTFERGRALFVQLRCFGCHDSPLIDAGFAPAPALDHIAVKSPPEVVAAWLRDPAGFRADTPMPSFWPEPRLASGELAPADSDVWKRWQTQRDSEIQSIIAYLATIAPESPLPEVAVPKLDDPALIARGQELFDTAGCRGCHALRGDDPRPADGWQSDFAPELSRIGEKASASWLAAWLADPQKVSPGTRMPNMRLTGDERDALVAYLVTLRKPGAPAAAPTWPEPSPEQAAAGKRAIRTYGCYGCHEIPGIGRVGKAGADLAGFGDKPPDRLAWGVAEVDCQGPPLECWTETKLQRPRWMSGHNLALVMPNPRVDAAGARALSVFLLAHRDHAPPASYHRTLTPSERALDQGEALVARLNCRGCHEIGRSEEKIYFDDGELDEIRYLPHGGEIRRFYPEIWDAPPPLTFAGRKFRYPWLSSFLAEPRSVRPWLVARMPRFALEPGERTALVSYFAARNDQPYPFPPPAPARISEDQRPEAAALFRDFQCYRCHQISGATGLQAGELAPDLSMVGERLRPDWVRDWLLDPQFLQPGTKMPTYFPIADPDEPDERSTPCPSCFGGSIEKQIEALLSVATDLDRGFDLARAPPATPAGQ